MPQLDDKYFSVREAARILGVAQASLVTAIADGELPLQKLPGIRFPMVARKDILKFAESRYNEDRTGKRGKKLRLFPLQIIRLNLEA